MPRYFMDFQNRTNRVWTMVMYQTLPNSIGLDSVVWLKATAPPGGETGEEFNVTYNVALGNFSQNGSRGVYKASQMLTADLKTAWEIVFEDGVQQLRQTGAAALPQQIVFTNKSGRDANPGIGMSGQPSVYKRSLNVGASAQFEVTPTYWIGLFDNVTKGEVISNNVVVGPERVVYPSGTDAGMLTAELDGSSIRLTLAYS